MLKIPGVYVDFKGDLSELKKDFRKAGALAKEAGTDISNGMKNAVLPNTVTSSFNKLYKDLTKINRVAALTGDDLKGLGVTIDKSLLKNIGLTDSEFKKLQIRMLNTKAEAQAERAIKSVGRAANLTSFELAGLYRKVGNNSAAMRALKNGFLDNLAIIGKFTAGVAVGAAGITALGYAVKRTSEMIWDSGLSYQRNIKALEEITGGSSEAAEQIEYLREVSGQYGQNLYDLIPAYKNFLAATSKSGMTLSDTRAVYEGIIKSVATMGLTAEQGSRILYAFQQMVSKGMRGISEEVNQQLGESLPGAFGMFADSVGVSESKLRKMMEQGDMTLQHLVKFGKYLGNTFSGEVSEAVRAGNQFNQAWEDLKITMADSGFMESATSALTDVTDTLKDPGLKDSMRAFASILGETLELLAKIPKLLPQLKAPDPVQTIDEQLKQLESRYQLMKRFEDLNSGMGGASRYDEWYQKERNKILNSARNDFDWQKVRAGFVALGEPNSPQDSTKTPPPGGRDDDAEKIATKQAAAWQSAYSSLDTITQATYDKMLGYYTKDYEDFVSLTGDKETAFALFSQKVSALHDKMYGPDTYDLDYGTENLERYNQLMSEGAQVTLAMRTPTEQIADETARLNELLDVGAINAETYGRAIAKAQEDIKSSAVDSSLEAYFSDIDAESERLAEKTTADWETAFSGWATSYSSTLNDMLWGSEATFEGIAESFGRMITEMIIKTQLLEPFMSWGFGGSGGGGGFVGDFLSSIFHDGGVVGSGDGGARAVSPMVFAGAPKFHTGLMPDEFAAILQRGETVFTANQTKALGGMIGSNQAPNVQINIENYTNSETDVSQTPPRWDGEQWVMGIVLKAMNNNTGNFRSTMKAKLSK